MYFSNHEPADTIDQTTSLTKPIPIKKAPPQLSVNNRERREAIPKTDFIDQISSVLSKHQLLMIQTDEFYSITTIFLVAV